MDTITQTLLVHSKQPSQSKATLVETFSEQVIRLCLTVLFEKRLEYELISIQQITVLCIPTFLS